MYRPTRPVRRVRRLRPDMVAVTVLAVLLILAVGVSLSACSAATGPAADPPTVTPGVVPDEPGGRPPAFSTVTVDGVEHPVPNSLPPDCRHAYVAIAPPLMIARDELKKLLGGDLSGDPDAAIAATDALMADQVSVASAILDCQSQSVPVARAYSAGVRAAGVANISLRIAGRGPYTVPGREGLEQDLTAIETALAQR